MRVNLPAILSELHSSAGQERVSRRPAVTCLANRACRAAAVETDTRPRLGRANPGTAVARPHLPPREGPVPLPAVRVGPGPPPLVALSAVLLGRASRWGHARIPLCRFAANRRPQRVEPVPVLELELELVPEPAQPVRERVKPPVIRRRASLSIRENAIRAFVARLRLLPAAL